MALNLRTALVPTSIIGSRDLVALALSLVLHLAASMSIYWLAVSAVRQANRSVDTQKSVNVVVVPAEDTSSVPGLNPMNRDDDAMIAPHIESPNIKIPGFRINISRIGDRSMMLFPFLTPGVALERFGLKPQRGPTGGGPTWQSRARIADPSKPVAPALAASHAEVQSLIGAIHWRRGDRTEALTYWRDMTRGDPTDSYSDARARLLQIIRAPEDVDARQIDTVLRGTQGKWLMFSIDRLRHFGYRLDTY
jgi:hypothetical protein